VRSRSSGSSTCRRTTSLQRDVTPPAGGTPPPATVELPNGDGISLIPLAEEISRRFFLEFPDEQGRYGDAGREWCVHDNQWLLAWAVEDLSVGGAHFANNVRWLAGILRARDYPAERLCRDLELAAEVVDERGPELRDLAEKLRSGSALLSRRSR
jgi:hypothetical protein